MLEKTNQKLKERFNYVGEPRFIREGLDAIVKGATSFSELQKLLENYDNEIACSIEAGDFDERFRPIKKEIKFTKADGTDVCIADIVGELIHVYKVKEITLETGLTVSGSEAIKGLENYIRVKGNTPISLEYIAMDV